jgi:hypothetical protein
VRFAWRSRSATGSWQRPPADDTAAPRG